MTRIVFMGTPELAAKVLAGLYEAKHDLALVITQPDRPKGRGRREGFSPVKSYAMEKDLPVLQPQSLRNQDIRERIRALAPEVITVAAYGKILPPEILEIAPMGCINVHASLLPAYRGAAPIQWALLNGEKETGVTIMKMDEGMDTGPVLLQEKLTIPEDMDYGGLYDALSAMGARLLLKTLLLWADHKLKPQSQPAEGVSYAERLTRAHEMIDWTKPAEAVRNQIRAFSPLPGASAGIGGKEIKIISAQVLTEEEAGQITGKPAKKEPGQIVGAVRKAGPVVAAGEGYLLLTRVQQAGKKPMDAWSWMNGSRLEPGQRFETKG